MDEETPLVECRWGRSHRAMSRLHAWVQDSTRDGAWWRVCNGRDFTICGPEEEEGVKRCKKCESVVAAGGPTVEDLLDFLCRIYPHCPTLGRIQRQFPLLRRERLCTDIMLGLRGDGRVYFQEHDGHVRYWPSAAVREQHGLAPLAL